MCKVLCIDVESSVRDGISTVEARGLLGISEEHIQRLCAAGELQAEKSGGWWWVDPQSLMAHAQRLGVAITWEDVIRYHCDYIRHGHVRRVDPTNFFLPSEAGERGLTV